MTVRDLHPQALWRHFADLNAVPRPSKREEQVVAWMMAFGQQLGLPTRRDEAGNVIISKPASPGREGQPGVILQSHLDMVHQKNAGTEFDFDREGIRMRVDGDWVRAEGTTLGADNGLGVAMSMAVLASQELTHPPLEALFTVDEETGMTGAKSLAPGLLQGQILLNLDTEDDRELTIGCAGGVDIVAEAHFHAVPAPKEFLVYRLRVSGLTGGHSGMDIHLGRANANKVLARILAALDREFSVALAQVDGGGLRNAIPREAFAVFGAPAVEAGGIDHLFSELSQAVRREYRSTDPELQVTLEQEEASGWLEVLPPEFQARLLRAVQAVPQGIYRLCPEVSGLVQTSSNLARWVVSERKVQTACLCRGSVDSEKMDMAESIRAAWELAGLEVRFEGAYGGWTPQPDSRIVRLMRQTYRELFGEEPLVSACHAGLECGILGVAYPEVEMVSFGPNIRGAHSPDEAVQISSVEKTWKLLCETLARL